LGKAGSECRVTFSRTLSREVDKEWDVVLMRGGVGRYHQIRTPQTSTCTRTMLAHSKRGGRGGGREERERVTHMRVQRNVSLTFQYALQHNGQ